MHDDRRQAPAEAPRNRPPRNRGNFNGREFSRGGGGNSQQVWAPFLRAFHGYLRAWYVHDKSQFHNTCNWCIAVTCKLKILLSLHVRTVRVTILYLLSILSRVSAAAAAAAVGRSAAAAAAPVRRVAGGTRAHRRRAPQARAAGRRGSLAQGVGHRQNLVSPTLICYCN